MTSPLDILRREHRDIAREDEVLLPLAERLLDATDLVRLKDSFDRIGGGIPLPDLETDIGTAIGPTPPPAARSTKRHSNP